MTDTRELDEIVIRTQSDLHRLWTLLLRPLGFGSTSLWLTFIGPDRRPVRSLAEITDCAELPTPHEVDQLFAMLATLLKDADDGTCVAFLITRPGSRGLRDDDTAVLALAPDDLAADGRVA